MRPPFIILEGPDGAGKTTLSAEIEAHFEDIETVHCSVPIRPPLAEYMEVVFTNLKNLNTPLLADRFHLGEQVYGPIARDGDQLGEDGRLLIEKALVRVYEPLVVLCLPPLKVCLKNWFSRKGREYIEVESQMTNVYESYRTVRTSLPLIHYDYTSAYSENVRNAVLQHFGRWLDR